MCHCTSGMLFLLLEVISMFCVGWQYCFQRGCRKALGGFQRSLRCRRAVPSLSADLCRTVLPRVAALSLLALDLIWGTDSSLLPFDMDLCKVQPRRSQQPEPEVTKYMGDSWSRLEIQMYWCIITFSEVSGCWLKWEILEVQTRSLFPFSSLSPLAYLDGASACEHSGMAGPCTRQ